MGGREAFFCNAMNTLFVDLLVKREQGWKLNVIAERHVVLHSVQPPQNEVEDADGITKRVG